MQLKGQIGIARRVHFLEQYDPGSLWGTSLCGEWAGHTRLVGPTVQVSCWKCREKSEGRHLEAGVWLRILAEDWRAQGGS